MYVFLFYFLAFFDHKRTKVQINEYIFALGTEKIAGISVSLNCRVSN